MSEKTIPDLKRFDGYQPSRAEFLKDVEHHRVQVVHDQDLHRCIRFARPGTGTYAFCITTWPGYLAISGDMGCFVFCRLQDMLEFFRRPDGAINAGYWAEKVVAEDHCSGIREWEPDLFCEWVQGRLRDAFDGEVPRELEQEVADEVLVHAGFQEEALLALRDFTSTTGGHHFEFVDALSEMGHACHRYTHRFIWCLRAIAWGIQVYDASKVPLPDSNGSGYTPPTEAERRSFKAVEG